MNANSVRWAFLGLIGCFFAAACVPGLLPQVSFGSSIQSVNGKTSVSGGSDPLYILFSFAILGLYAALMRAERPGTVAPSPALFRRYLAFFLDFFFAMMILGPIVGLLPMLAEWWTTGIFQWTFARETATPHDWPVAIACLLLMFGGLVFWYATPLVFGRPSPGSLIFRYQIVANDGLPLTRNAALLRSFLGFFAACGAVLAPFFNRDRSRGKIWLDERLKTHAVKLK